MGKNDPANGGVNPNLIRDLSPDIIGTSRNTVEIQRCHCGSRFVGARQSHEVLKGMDTIEQIKQKLGSKIKKFEEKNSKRYYIDILPADIVDASRVLFNDMKLRFIIATGIDRRDGLEILYHFSEDKTGKVISIRVLMTDKEKPEIDTISNVIKGSEWIEREMWELLGINFKGHPNLKHLLLTDDWPSGDYPLRQGKGEGRKSD